ncbi:MAG: branched-chain amino acid ABC transporter permease [Reyranella sp.]|nr:MAG: branched-chain amino acid ABC transporter permease [Reyranella sp.]
MLTFQGFKAGMRRMAGVALFGVPFGFAFGAGAVEAGLSIAQTVAMSTIVHAGASQFAMLELWRQPLPLLSIAVVVLAVNARHIIFGAALAPLLNALPLRHRLLSALWLSDANFADMQAARQSGSRDLGILVGGGFVMWLSWVSSTALGALVGGSEKDLSRFGIDVVMAAFFVAVIATPARRIENLLPIGAAALVSVATLSLLPHGWNVIAGALAGGIAGVIRER